MDTRGDARRSRIFDGLTEAERLDCLSAADALTLRRGHWLARQGEPATAFCVVDSGALKLLQDTPQGQEVIVRFVGPGEPFGGVAVLDGSSYPVSALVIEPTRLYAWRAAALRRVLDAFPGVRLNIVREMTTHMTEALTRVREMTTLRVGQRLAIALMRLARQCGRETPEGVLITHPLTRQDLANMTGTTLYTVSRTLSQWEAAGIVRSRKRFLLLRLPKRLTRLATDETETSIEGA